MYVPFRVCQALQPMVVILETKLHQPPAHHINPGYLHLALRLLHQTQ